ncbi:MAG: hypothetical protein N4A44_00790 [Alphaproteobacteria bacterium]|nr:hypothetical protein [Alphaproteobacteria bacterium]
MNKESFFNVQNAFKDVNYLHGFGSGDLYKIAYPKAVEAVEEADAEEEEKDVVKIFSIQEGNVLSKFYYPTELGALTNKSTYVTLLLGTEQAIKEEVVEQITGEKSGGLLFIYQDSWFIMKRSDLNVEVVGDTNLRVAIKKHEE